MNKLLSSNFSRLKKDKVFWIGIIFMFGYGILLTLTQNAELKKIGGNMPLEELFYGYALLNGLFAAIFCSLFIGTEYSDGTIRNKLIIGHSRSAIYFSNLIVSYVVLLLMSVSYMIAVCALGIPLLGYFQTDIWNVLTYMFFSTITVLAFCSIFTLISMLNQNKAIVAIISIIGFFALFMSSTYIDSKLREPEIYRDITYVDDQGEVVRKDMPNPIYIKGTEREIYEFLFDFIPTAQALQIFRMDERNWRLPLYSLFIVIVTTGAGVICFRRKDLK